MIEGISHITFSVSNLEASLAFYQQVFGATVLLRTETMAYLDLASLWLALNVQEDIPREETRHSYTHPAFAVAEADIPAMALRLQALGITVKPDRRRGPGEGASLYFADPDGHLLEVHAGNRETRIRAYQNEIFSAADK